MSRARTIRVEGVKLNLVGANGVGKPGGVTTWSVIELEGRRWDWSRSDAVEAPKRPFRYETERAALRAAVRAARRKS